MFGLRIPTASEFLLTAALIMSTEQFPATAGHPSQASIEEGLRRAMRPTPGRAALRVAPGPQPELRRIVFSLLRELAQVKGGALLEIASGDWLLSEAPALEAERLASLIGKLLPEGHLRILPLPQSKAIIAELLESRPLPKLLELPLVDTVSPLGLEMKLSQINPGWVFSRRSYVSFKQQGTPALRLQRLGLDISALRQAIGNYAQDQSLLRHAETELQKKLLEALGEDGGRAALLGGAPAAPLLIDMPATLLPAPPAAEADARDPAAMTMLFATMALHEAISLETLAARKNSLKRDAWGIAISGLSAKTLPLVNMQALPADWVILEWSPELAENTSLKLLGQLDPSRLILDGCDQKSALVFGFSLGISCYGGPWIEDLVAAARMDFCPQSELCTRAECRVRGLAAAPYGRLGCYMPHVLEAVLPETAA